jgi:molecular chaperone Hsp33
MSDKIIRATGEIAELRFVLVDATEAANTIGGFHGAHAFARIFLGETITSALLLASGLKSNGTAQVKFQFSGDLSLVTADATPLGLVRGMIPTEEIRGIGDFEPLLSPQLMTVRKLNEQGLRVSEGIVEMPSENIGATTAFYLLQSEQTKSAVGIKAKADSTGAALEFCGGYLVEALPKADEKTLAIMEQVVRSMPSLDTYYRPGQGLDLMALLSDLAGPFKFTVHREIPVRAYCPCSEAGVMKALTGLPRTELEEICIRQETIELHCEYCRKRYLALPEQVRSIIDKLKGNADESPPGSE